MVIYELHVGGFTEQRDVPPALRGTLPAWPARPWSTICAPGRDHRAMPVHASDDRYLVDRDCNYKGYNTIGFFAPTSTAHRARSPSSRPW